MTPQFVETIKVVDGVAQNLDLHQRRMDATMTHFAPDAERLIINPSNIACGNGVWKARIVYTPETGHMTYESAPYSLRPLHSLRTLTADDIDYKYKSTDRRHLQFLHDACTDADDALIVRHGLVTDTTYANVAIWDGTRWLTPSEPLLRGTRRAALLRDGKIFESEIPASSLTPTTPIMVFNAMIEPGQIIVDHVLF